MAYLGTAPAEAYSPTAVKDSFNGDGSTVAFTMSQPSKTNDVRVVVENVVQDPTVAYSCSGTTITFTSAPPVGTANVYVVHLGLPVQSIVPPDEINIATTYTSDLTVQGAFTSQGIDDNANATAITIDSSENVIVGKTSTAIENAGASLLSTGRLIATAENDDVVVLRRNSSDGDLISLRKDGTTVGSIGVLSNRLSIGTGDTGLFFNDQTDQVQPFNTSTNAARDAAIDLGTTDRRFKDLYLSGGVYLGGIGSANKLEDVETGSWEPEVLGTSTDPTVTYHGDNGGYYIKVGRMVYLTGCVRWTALSGGSGNFNIGNLPFGNSARTNGDNADSIGAARTIVWGGTSTRTPTAVGMRSITTNLNVFATRYDNAAHTVTMSDLGSTGMVQFSVIVYTG